MKKNKIENLMFYEYIYMVNYFERIFPGLTMKIFKRKSPAIYSNRQTYETDL